MNTTSHPAVGRIGLYRSTVGFGDGVAIENNPEHCVAFHDLMLGNDILFIEVMQNIGKLRDSKFPVVFQPLPIRGLDSSPVNVVAIEGVAGFGPESGDVAESLYPGPFDPAECSRLGEGQTVTDASNYP